MKYIALPMMGFLITMTMALPASAGFEICRKPELTGVWIFPWADPSIQVGDVCTIRVNQNGNIMPAESSCFLRNSSRLNGTLKVTARCEVSLFLRFTDGTILRGGFALNRNRDMLGGVILDDYGNTLGTATMMKQ